MAVSLLLALSLALVEAATVDAAVQQYRRVVDCSSILSSSILITFDSAHEIKLLKSLVQDLSFMDLLLADG